jgi:4-hydroxythreonine-4-phosphate dehydrogenase
VALTTIHISLSQVPVSLTKELILDKLSLLNDSLVRDFRIEKPVIAVLGLNPHAGEDGAIGKEEKDIIIPAINEANSMGIITKGPFPGDGFFAHNDYLNHDGILAMYHDQGLIPLKLLAKGGGVNFTAGINIVRTSPDHGTAFSIAGQNTANPLSSLNALEYAVQISRNRFNY